MKFISYEQFGVRFVSHAVNRDRIADAITGVTGSDFDVGPMSAGPGGVADVVARGRMGDVEVQSPAGEPLQFLAILPVDLELEVRLAVSRHRYHGNIRVPLHLTVRTADPLKLVIEVAEVAARDVEVDLRALGMAAGMLQRVGDIDREVRKSVARIVNQRVASDEARASREIDVAALIDKAWSGNRSR